MDVNTIMQTTTAMLVAVAWKAAGAFVLWLVVRTRRVEGGWS